MCGASHYSMMESFEGVTFVTHTIDLSWLRDTHVELVTFALLRRVNHVQDRLINNVSEDSSVQLSTCNASRII